MDLFPGKRILTVTQLTRLVKEVVEENFEQVWVEGEVSNLALPASGHLYFTLKDAGAQVRCVMFRASARMLRFKAADGMAMVVRGRMTVFEQRGDYQLLVEYMEPKGIGALQLAFIQLKEKLAKEGLFAEVRKKPLPQLPQRIGIVTSPTGAAIHDMLNVLGRRFSNVEVLIAPVRVQGEGAAGEIAAAIRDFNRYRDVDVLIVGRGGGSMEDLWAFNEEIVVRAIADSKIPVISAVGHEIDFTIADFVADLRAPTPSAAAELVLRSKDELEGEVAELYRRLATAMRHRLQTSQSIVASLSHGLKDPTLQLGYLMQRLDDLDERLENGFRQVLFRYHTRCDALKSRLRLLHPAVELERRRERLSMSRERMERAVLRIIDRYRETLAVKSGTLQALSPLHTLARGYSIVRKLPQFQVITDSTRLVPGEQLDLRFYRGSAVCRVEDVE